MIGGTHYKIDAFELCFSWDTVHTVNVSVIAGFNIVFVKNIYNLTANKITPNGREVEKEKNRFFALTAQLNGFIETHSQTNDFAIDNTAVINGSNRVLLRFFYKPTARTANNAVSHIVGVVVKNIDGIHFVLCKKGFHFAGG